MANDSLRTFRGAASSVSSSIMSKVYALKAYFFKERLVTIFCANGELIAKKRFRCIIFALFSSFLNFFKLIYNTLSKKCNSNIGHAKPSTIYLFHNLVSIIRTLYRVRIVTASQYF